MILTFIIVFVSLMGLLVLHEFGHFILAKRFGVKVEEFGIGYPPRLFGKKIGETIYSLNLLPFGAFIKVPGEVERTGDPGSFSSQPIRKRALIMLGGILSFWIMAAILFSAVSAMGTPMAVGDEDNSGLTNPKVQIADVSRNSPAEKAGIRAGDTIKKFSIFNFQFSINKVKDVQELAEKYKGQEVVLTIERGKEVFDVSLVPRVLPPQGEGAMGLALVRTAVKSYPWYEAPWQGISQTFELTLSVLQGYSQAIQNVFKGAPSGIQLAGPVGIFHLMAQASQLGVNYFLNFLGLIAVYLAIFNALPIPAVDGGKLLFLGIEGLRRKPVPQKIEQNITTAFFLALIILMVFVTIKDVARLF